MDTTSLRKSFESLPQPIKDWLTSEQTTLRIIEINKRVDVTGNTLSVIPKLILRLVIKDLNPRNFIDEIRRGLDVTDETAKTITQEIEQAILRPIAINLRREVGIDINEIYSPPTVPTRPAPVPPMPTVTTPPVPTPVPPRPTPIPPTIPPASKPSTPPPPPPPPPIKIPINVQPSKPPLPPIPPKQNQ
jgi:hypothetical protein